jgi:hypothetical protein
MEYGTHVLDTTATNKERDQPTRVFYLSKTNQAAPAAPAFNASSPARTGAGVTPPVVGLYVCGCKVNYKHRQFVFRNNFDCKVTCFDDDEREQEEGRLTIHP